MLCCASRDLSYALAGTVVSAPRAALICHKIKKSFIINVLYLTNLLRYHIYVGQITLHSGSAEALATLVAGASAPDLPPEKP